MSNDDQVPPPLVGPRKYRPGQSSQKQPQSQQSSQKQPPSGYVPPPGVGQRTTYLDPVSNTVSNVKPQISSLGGSINPTVSSTTVPGPPITPTVSSTAVPGSSVSTPSTVVSTSIDFKNEDVIAGVIDELFNIKDSGFNKTNYDDLKTDIENATKGKNFKHLIERFFYNKAELGLTEKDLKKYDKLYFGGTPEQDIRTQMKDADKIKPTNIDWYFTVYIVPRTQAVIREVETTMAAKNLKDMDTLLLNKYGFTIGLEHNVNHRRFDELERNIMGSKLSGLKHLIFKTYTNEIPPSDKKKYEDQFYKDSLSQTDIEDLMTNAGVFKPSAIADFVATLKNDMDRREYEKYDSYYFGDNMIEASVRVEMGNENVPQVKQTWYFNVHVPQVKKEVHDAIIKAIDDHGDKSLPVIDNILYSNYKFKPHVDGNLERLYNGKKKEDFEKTIDALNIDDPNEVKLEIHKAYKILPYSVQIKYEEEIKKKTKDYTQIQIELNDSGLYDKDAIDIFTERISPEIKNPGVLKRYTLLHFFDNMDKADLVNEMNKDGLPEWKQEWFFNVHVTSTNKTVQDEMDNAIRTLKGDALIKQVDQTLYDNDLQETNNRLQDYVHRNILESIETVFKNLHDKGFSDYTEQFFHEAKIGLSPSEKKHYEDLLDNDTKTFTDVKDEIERIGLPKNIEDAIFKELDPEIKEKVIFDQIYTLKDLTTDTKDKLERLGNLRKRQINWFIGTKLPDILNDIEVKINNNNLKNFIEFAKEYGLTIGNEKWVEKNLKAFEIAIDNSLFKGFKLKIFKKYKLGIPPTISRKYMNEITNKPGSTTTDVDSIISRMKGSTDYDDNDINKFKTTLDALVVRKFDLRNTK